MPRQQRKRGSKKKVKARKGNKYAKCILNQAAWANARNGNRIGEYFRRIRKRRGEQKAAVATAHLILRIAYAMLRDRVEYKHIEQFIFPTPTEKIAERLTNQLKLLGFNVTLEPTGTQ